MSKRSKDELNLKERTGFVCINVAVSAPIQQLLTYRVPVEKMPLLQAGRRVLVPLGKRRSTGYIVDLEQNAKPEDCREIIEFLDETLSEGTVEILIWASRYYMFPPGEALKLAFPGGSSTKSTRLTLTRRGQEALKRGSKLLQVQGMEVNPTQMLVLKRLKDATRALTKPFLLRETNQPAKVLDDLIKRDLIKVEQTINRGVSAQIETFVTTKVELDDNSKERLSRRSPRMWSIYREVLGAEGPISLSQLRSKDPNARQRIRSLEAKGIVQTREVEQPRDPFSRMNKVACPIVTLNERQKAAIDSISGGLEANEFQPFLLHGVTGSGKTEVYLDLIGKALHKGRTALTLVPEIALTPQLAGRFHARFPGRVAVLHSGLSQGEKRDSWKAIGEGRLDIVVGARSALFAPLSDIGVIVIDEEHDSSFKQQNGLRYHARDLALVRGRQEKAVVVLGSATPSMESYANAKAGKYTLLRLPDRATVSPLPAVEILDLKRYEAFQGALTAPLRKALRETLEAKQQAILFLNRRGFAPYLICRGCGEAVSCPHCSVSLTWHRSHNKAVCHYCGHTVPTPQRCEKCKTPEPRPVGLGTEKLTDLIREEFPDAAVARLDRDSSSLGRLTKVLDAFRNRQLDVLVGTQMVTKGHDFPGVTLVGVVLADHGLNFPDFRSSERTFQLLCQVAGRAGRGDTPGRVIVQTYNPHHHSLICSKDHDFEGFYEQELRLRSRLGYPPAGHLVALKFSGTDPQEVALSAQKIAEQAQKETGREGVDLLGPSEAPLSRLKGQARWHILLKSFARKPLHELSRRLLFSNRKALSTNVRMVVDVDPLDMM